MKKILVFATAILISLFLVGCRNKNKELPFDIYEWTDEYGDKTNNEDLTKYDSSYTVGSFKVKPVEELTNGKRSDFIMAVDASMVEQVYKMGGTYYNLNGIEQNVWQILANAGVNYIRIRLWNDPSSPIGVNGGGNCDLETVYKMILEARKVNMRFILDLHYSDTWADPDTQSIPYEWELLSFDELKDAVYQYTKDTVNYFKDRGVVPQMIQIGNEINNGLLWEEGRIVWNDETSYDRVADLLKAGLKGAKEAYPGIKTIIHLAEGGKYDVLDTFFGKMKERNVEYDIIGLSFYTFYHGTLDNLEDVMNKLSAKYNKKIIVAEMSYAYTHLEDDNAAHIFGSNQEENGSYLASIQGQASCIRDTIASVARVDNDMGLGICYWEPAWLPVSGAGWAESGTKATWSNQALFTYGGKALPSIETFKLVRSAPDFDLEIVGLKSNEVSYTLNIASTLDTDKKMPTQVIGLSNVDSYIWFDVTWNKTEKEYAESNVGTHTVSGTVSNKGESWSVTATVRTIENFVINPGFEIGKTSQADSPVIPPWYVIESETDVTKLQTAKDFRTGLNNFNYYHTQAFSYDLYQDITNLPNGTYSLSVYIMGESQSYVTDLYLYAEINGIKVNQANLFVSGWANGYRIYTLEGIVVENGQLRIGVFGQFSRGTWGHIDDFELIRTS